MVSPLSLASAPCDYWYNYNWYDLSTIEKVGSTEFWTSNVNPLNEIVSFSFCSKLNSGDPDVQPLACEDLDLYATEHSRPTQQHQLVTCNPLSTSSSESIKSVAFSGDIGEMDFDRNFAVKFSRELCGLTVVMDCND